MQRFIDKIRVPVRIHPVGGDTIEGWLALGPQARFHDGPETILELLNQPLRVLPVLRADGTDLLLTRQAILWVEAGAEVEPSWVSPLSIAISREERVEVRFEDGQHLVGVLQMELPEDMNRASDYLNGTEDFCPLIVTGSTAIFNKSRVGGVRLYETSQLPVAAGGS